jgi:HD-GYP domain-containing protein (c-di-GMP phosphodiesterase class II)
MNLFSLNAASIPLNTPLPFALRAPTGVLLAHKGFVITSRAQVDEWMTRNGGLCLDWAESQAYERAYRGRLDALVRENRPLGQIANMQIEAGALMDASRPAAASAPPGIPVWPDWKEMQVRATAILRHPNEPGFLDKVGRLHEELMHWARTRPDAVLFALIHTALRSMHMYSATHAMLVCVMCDIAARQVLQWPEAKIVSLGRAALTMNISMTEMQDHLALQAEPTSEWQLAVIGQHAQRSRDILASLGVDDPLWLGAIEQHHTKDTGSLASLEPARRVAQVIERADVFSARMSMRNSRESLSSTMAMQASYLDHHNKVDEVGSAMIKALGLYPPGSFVRLASGEVAAVLQRGANATSPRVAAVLNREGMPLGVTAVRDTAQPAYKVVASVARHDVRIELQLTQMLQLIG